jgi:transcriptional regulator with AAA-type ATPase domain
LEFINALLMWMERGEYNPVGNDDEPLISRAIVIMAMVGDPRDKYQKSEWKLDFINRFKEIIEIPSLRNSVCDILPLAEFFANRYLAQHFRDITNEIEFSGELKYKLETYGWPGNVRELENTVEKWVKKTICNITTATTSKIILSEKLFDENPPLLAKCKPNGNRRGYYFNPPNSLDEFDNIISPAFQIQVLENLKSRAQKQDKKKIQKRIERLRAKDSDNITNPEIGPIATNSGPVIKHRQNQYHAPTPIRTST